MRVLTQPGVCSDKTLNSDRLLMNQRGTKVTGSLTAHDNLTRQQRPPPVPTNTRRSSMNPGPGVPGVPGIGIFVFASQVRHPVYL